MTYGSEPSYSRRHTSSVGKTERTNYCGNHKAELGCLFFAKDLVDHQNEAGTLLDIGNWLACEYEA